jgi:hypothetical protein
MVEEQGQAPPDWMRLVLGALLGSAALLGYGAALAAEDSIRASGFGLRVATSLRRLAWPVLELRGAIPAGYWMRLHPIRLTVLSVLGFVFATPHLPLLCLGCTHEVFDELPVAHWLHFR